MKQIYDLPAGELSLRLTVYSDAIVRITCGRDLRQVPESMIVTADLSAMPDVSAETEENETAFTLRTGRLCVTVNKKTQEVAFTRPDGTLLSRLSGQELTEYDILRTTGGNAEIRETVDAQLTGMLEKRLGQSFQQVTRQLEQVHRGLG